MADSTRYSCDYSKRKSNCKKCKLPIDKGACRIAKVVPNHYNDGEGELKQYHHLPCMFEVFKRMRATTKKVEHFSDLENFSEMKEEEKNQIKSLIEELMSFSASKTSNKPQKRKNSEPAVKENKRVKKIINTKEVTKEQDKNVKVDQSQQIQQAETDVDKLQKKKESPQLGTSKDDKFREFRRLCGMIANESSYKKKSEIIKEFYTNGSTGNGFTGDLYISVKLLLPGAVKRVYNLQSKQLVKIFSQIFQEDLDEMYTDLEQGDVAETISKFFQQSSKCPPQKKSTITIQNVDNWLDRLSQLTREEDQMRLLKKISAASTPNDLQTVIRLIKSDLKIQAGAKHVLDAFDSNAYEAFKASRDLADIIDRIKEKEKNGKSLDVVSVLMTPVAPMLAAPCKSVDQAMKKCPKGMFSEIKYDGERVQLHKNGDQFFFYSRSLKPVQKHKVSEFEEFIPKAFPGGHSAILDCEVLLINRKTGCPLPFGTLGIHKKTEFAEANVCLFVFDILHFNGENLMSKSIKKRRKILEQNMTNIPNRVMLSEMKFIIKSSDLRDMIVRVIKDGLEGLVLKDINSIYEPGKRHWLKVKKDYLLQGQMADSADLVVLGAYFGTGNKGGMMSVFLMGCYCDATKSWHTVTKVGNGHDDKTLEKINEVLKVEKISKDYSKVPKWLRVNKMHVPDFVVENPKLSPVWEISGTEFTKSDLHTADGISIRFPRVTKVREDKTWKTSTSLKELHNLYTKSQEDTDMSTFIKITDNSDVCDKISFMNNLFQNSKVYISDQVKDFDLLRRHVIAGDGDVVAEDEIHLATHVVSHLSADHFNLSAVVKFLSPERLRQHIKNKEKLN